jgi:rod shape-determining protein MreB
VLIHGFILKIILSRYLIQIIFNIKSSKPMPRDILYIRIKPSLLSVKNVTAGLLYENVPLIALSKTKKTLLEAGKSAENYSNDDTSVIINGFDSPRSIIGDFDLAEKTFHWFLKQIEPKKAWWQFLPSVPIMVIHPLEKVEGDLTEVEARALENLGYRARAADVYVWTGRVLTDAEVQSLQFPNEGKLYNK